MLQFLIAAFSLCGIILAAPSSGGPAAITPLIAPQQQQQQYILLPAQNQYHFQPTLKLQQPIVQQLTPLGRIQTQKEQLVVLYPNAPLAQYPLMLKQDAGGNTDWWAVVQNFFQNIGSNIGGQTELPASPPSVEKPSESGSGSKMEMMAAEKLPAKFLSPESASALAPAPAPLALAPAMASAPTPAHVEQLSNDKRYYIISGQPQFFGNFDALNNPMNPIISLQPLQLIKARSSEESIQAEPSDMDVRSALAQPQLQQQEFAPLQADAAAAATMEQQPQQQQQQQAFIEQPQLRTEQQQQQQLPASVVDEIASNDPSVIAVRQQLARFLASDQSASQTASENFDNLPMATLADLSAAAAAAAAADASAAASSSDTDTMAELKKESNASQLKEITFNIEDDTSIAQAKPNAISLSGRGGLSSSAPVATALVGDGGLAVSAPSATAVSGDFELEDDDEDRKKSKA